MTQDNRLVISHANPSVNAEPPGELIERSGLFDTRHMQIPASKNLREAVP
ncbi:MAG: hypothetical protein JXB13_03225 [Phycisphaerae bacterium]|nr:hypothetical protein [Phycisphaerae bacterium]